MLQGDPNVPAGQLTLDVDLSQPVDLPELDQQRKIDVLSRIILGIHEKVQREAEPPASSTAASVRHAAEEAGGARAEATEVDHGACAEETEVNHGACAVSCQSGPSSSSSPPEAQPFVLPLGVMARNEVYPRTCRKW